MSSHGIIKSNMFNPSQHIILNKTLKSLEFNVESSEVIIDSWEPEKTTVSISVKNDVTLSFFTQFFQYELTRSAVKQFSILFRLPRAGVVNKFSYLILKPKSIFFK